MCYCGCMYEKFIDPTTVICTAPRGARCPLEDDDDDDLEEQDEMAPEEDCDEEE